MTGANKRRLERFFPQEANELREIARTVKTFGLPTLSTDRAVARIRQIADKIDGRTETIEQGAKGKGAKLCSAAILIAPSRLICGNVAFSSTAKRLSAAATAR